jgi:serine/threonine protein kinase
MAGGKPKEALGAIVLRVWTLDGVASMVAIGTDTFIEMLRRSRLVDNDQLEKALAEIQRDGGAQVADDPRALSDKLIAAKLITPWQRDQLLQGRYKGFFIVGDKYKLLGLLGTGGMSSVYLASQVKMNRLVAIKHLPKNRVSDSSYLARFYREAEAAAKLDHKNIVRAIDIDHDEKDNHFFIMEYVEGRDLQSLVRDSGTLEYDAAADYIRQAAEGLEHAHQAGLLHRDIKPANLLVNPHGVVKVLDMGLARWEQDDKTASLTIAHEENVLGTADYLPPEQARDSHSVDKRADIYSLGCTLYFLLTGHPPFPDGTLAQRIWKHQNQMPESIFNDRKDAPSDLVEVCMRMMAKQPDARFQSAGEVAHTLGKWLDKRSKPDAAGGAGFGRRLIGPPPRRSPLRSGAFPITPPRRSEKPTNDDTVSNMQHDTIKGVPGKGSSQSSTGQSQVKYGSGVLGPQGSSSGRGSGSFAARGGSSILGLGGSSILGKAGASGKGPGKSSSKSLPVAKSLDGPKGQGEAAKSALQKSLSASQAAKIVRDDSLGNLIDQAVREVKVAAPHLDQASGAQPAMKMAPKPGSSIPSGVWLVIGGTVLLAALLGALLYIFH